MSGIALRPTLLVLLLWLAGLGASAQFAKIAVPFDAYAAHYPNVGAGLGWLLSIISLVGVFLGMTAGILAAKFGYQRLLVLALVLGALMSFWQALFPSFPVMLFSRVLEGVSHLIIVVVAPTMIAQISSDRFRGLAMTLWSTFFGVSFALMAWFGLPFVVEYGLHSLLMSHGLIMLLVALLLLAAFRSTFIDLPKTSDRLTLNSILQQHRVAYRSANIVAPAVGWLFYTITFVALLAVIPATLPPEHRATVVAFMPLLSIVSALGVVSLLLNVLTAVQIVMLGFVLAVAVLLSYFAGLPASQVFLALFAVLGLVQGASFAAIAQLNSSMADRAMSSGALAQMGNLGNSFGTPVLMAILAGFGTAGLLISISILYATGAIAHLILAHRRARQSA